MKWIETIEDRIENWKNNFDSETKDKLDFSPSSLLIVEEILLKRFPDVNALRSDSNFEFMDSCVTYMGEVFIRNDKIRDLQWVPNTSRKKRLGYIECPNHANSSVVIPGQFAYMMNVRTGRVLYEFFIGNTEHFKMEHLKQKRLKDAVNKEIPGKGGYCYQYFLLVKEESFSLSEIEQALKIYYAKRAKNNKVSFHNDKYLLVDIGNDYYFHFQLDTKDSVLQESEEIAESYKGNKDRATIASCKSRVEFWGDEDANGDYLNDHMFILEQIMKNEKLLIYDYRNGVIFDEI